MIQNAIVATTSDSLVIPAKPYRIYLHIRNYANAPGTSTPQTLPIWIAFGQVATAGNNGELELIPGAEYIWGDLSYGESTYQHHGCPTDAIHVITIAGGPVFGCILTTVGG